MDINHSAFYKVLYSFLALCVGLSGFAQNWNQITKTTASDRNSNDWFGYSVSISGDYAIIGADQEDDDTSGINSMIDAGSAYIFERNVAGNWNEVQKIVASDRANFDFFGSSVSISGDYAVVGAFGEDDDIVGNNNMGYSGSAYIFERNSFGHWNQVQKIIASDRNANDRFGNSVSISGDYIAIGAFQEDDDPLGNNSRFNSGSVYIFERNRLGVWNQVQKVVASDRSGGDRFGTSVSISGNYSIIGAPEEDHDVLGANSMSDAGSAYIFERSATGVWNEVKKVVASDRATSDLLGYSVSISGDYSIIGAFSEDEDVSGSSTMNSAGASYIFERDSSGIWSEVQKIVASDRTQDDFFAFSVSISGIYAIVGAHAEDEDITGSNSLSLAGSAYIFKRNSSGIWNETQKIVASDRAIDDRFGWSTAISGNDAIAGAIYEDENNIGRVTRNNAGSAYIFKTNSTVGLIENNFRDEILLYPNPSVTDFSIDLGANYKSVNISITDLTGRLIQTKKYYNSQLLNVNLEASKGVYLLKIESDHKKAVVRLIRK